MPRLLLSDGSGLTSRQVATQAAYAGHRVDVLAPTRIPATRFTRHVARVHRVPPFGEDPERWLASTLRLLATGRHDVLLPTQEQVTILARDAPRVHALGVALAVPSFGAMRHLQDKVAQSATLSALGLPQPATWVARSAAQLLARADPPVYLKLPIGTASRGVRLARDREQLVRAARELDLSDGVVVQEPVRGPLVMVQAVFQRSALVAAHAVVREREGIAGGATNKRSVTVDGVERHLRTLGDALGWHGALSLDAVLTEDGPTYIDVNPRLVEPGSAWHAGVDLVEALIDVSLGHPRIPRRPARAGVRTHQLLLGVLGASRAERPRRAIVRELADATRHRGPYHASAEELTPIRGDPLAVVPTAAATIASLVHPSAGRRLSDAAISAYSLSPLAWRRIVDGADRR